jgi:hypothetical protein
MKVRFPYLRSYKDRHGKVRVEYRRNGKTIALKATPGTAEFQSEYDLAKALMDGGEPSQPRSSFLVKAGTFRAFVVDYFRSTEFGQLAPLTQHMRRLLLESMLQEPAQPGSTFLFADYPVARMEAKHIRVLRDRKKDLPNAANHRIKTLRSLFKWATDNNKAFSNPARDVPYLNSRSEGLHSWTIDEVEQFERARNAIGHELPGAFGAVETAIGRYDQPVLAGVEAVEAAALLAGGGVPEAGGAVSR